MQVYYDRASASCHAGWSKPGSFAARAISIEAWELSIAHWAACRRSSAGRPAYCACRFLSYPSFSTSSRNGISASVSCLRRRFFDVFLLLLITYSCSPKLPASESKKIAIGIG